MFNAESPFRRATYRPRLAQAAGVPPGAIPTSPMPVSAPVGAAPLPAAPAAPAPAPAPLPVVSSAVGDKILLGAGILLGSGVAWLGYRTGTREKSTAAKVAGFGLGGIGAIKALWDAGTLLGWPADRFPA